MPPVGNGARAVEDLAEDQQPENGLNHAREKLDGIVNEFADVGFGDGQRLAQIVRAGKRLSPVAEM